MRTPERVTRAGKARPGDWEAALPRPRYRFSDGAVSEGVHGTDRGAWVSEVPPLWPLYVLEAGSAVWLPGSYWRRRACTRVAVELVTAGNLYLRQDGREYVVGAGQAMILRYGSDHVYATGPAGLAHKRFVTLTGPAVRMLFEVTGLGRTDVVDLQDPRAMAALVKQAMRLCAARPAGFEKKLSALAYAVINELVASMANRRPELVRLVIAHLQQNMDRPVANQELARLVGVTTGYVVRRFRAEMGQTPQKYHRGLRLALARRLLQTTPSSAKEIAARTGFSDPLYFSRVFRAGSGMSPRQFRGHEAER